MVAESSVYSIRVHQTLRDFLPFLIFLSKRSVFYIAASFTFSFTYSLRFEENISKPGDKETSKNTEKVDRCAEVNTPRNSGAQLS